MFLIQLRNKLEFVNHKILDCMGDLFLSIYKIIGNLKCSQGGHKLTNQLFKKVFSDKQLFINEVKTTTSYDYRVLNQLHKS